MRTPPSMPARATTHFCLGQCGAPSFNDTCSALHPKGPHEHVFAVVRDVLGYIVNYQKLLKPMHNQVVRIRVPRLGVCSPRTAQEHIQIVSVVHATHQCTSRRRALDPTFNEAEE